MNVFLDQPAVSEEIFKRYLSHQGRSRPAMLICETVNACNLDCIICAYSLQQRKRQIMPLATFEKVIRDYEAMGGGCLSLTPTVGDVFLDALLPERFKIIERFKSITAVSVTTNAVLASKWLPDELDFILSRLSRVHISIYGLDRAEYNAMTRRDKYEAMLQSVRIILDHCSEDSKICIGFRLLKKRPDQEVYDWIQTHFGRSLPFNVTLKYANWGVFDVSKPLPFDAQWIMPQAQKGQCMIPLVAMQISSNGDVSFCPCDDFQNTEELYLGNVTETSLLDLYNTEKVRKLYNFEAHTPEFCRTCSFHRPLTDVVAVKSMCVDPISFIGG